MIELLGPHTVCKEGVEVSAAAAAVLKVFDYKLATFRLILDSVWQNGAFEARLSRPIPAPFCSMNSHSHALSPAPLMMKCVSALLS